MYKRRQYQDNFENSEVSLYRLAAPYRAGSRGYHAIKPVIAR